jgi:hypothetical protein
MEHVDDIRVVSTLRVTRCGPSSTPLLSGLRAYNGYRRVIGAEEYADSLARAIGLSWCVDEVRDWSMVAAARAGGGAGVEWRSGRWCPDAYGRCRMRQTTGRVIDVVASASRSDPEAEGSVAQARRCGQLGARPEVCLFLRSVRDVDDG